MDQEKKGDDLVNQAEKRLKAWSWSGSKYEDAAELFEKAGTAYKVAKAWEKAANIYKRLSEIQVTKLDGKYESASALVDAANCFRKLNSPGAFECLHEAIDVFIDIGKLSMAARHSKEMAEMYEKEDNADKAIYWFEKACDLYQSESSNSTTVNQIKLKIAESSALAEQYSKATEIIEQVARDSLESNLLKYSVKGYLLNAGICHLCSGDHVSIFNAIEKYQSMDPAFSGSRECKLLEELAKAIEKADLDAFTDSVKEFDSMTRLDNWKTTLLLRAKNKIIEEPDIC